MRQQYVEQAYRIGRHDFDLKGENKNPFNEQERYLQWKAYELGFKQAKEYFEFMESISSLPN